MILSQIATSVMNCIALLLILYMARNNEMLLRRKKRQFSNVILVTTLVIAAEACSVVLEQQPSAFRLPTILVNLVGFSLSPLIPVMVAGLFDTEYWDRNRWFFFISAVNLVVVLSSPYTGAIFTVTEQNQYLRGSFFWIYIVSYSMGLILLFWTVIKAWRASYNRGNLLLLLMFGYAAVGTTVQVVFPQIHTTWTCTTHLIILYYVFFCENNGRQDALTSLLSRRVYDNSLAHFSLAGSGMVVLCDVDDFKGVNDLYGHQFGDNCLNKLGNVTRQAFSRIGAGYRIGGDEFCVICENAGEEEVSAAMAVLIQDIILLRQRDPRFPTISYGSSPFSQEGGGIQPAIKAADEKMYSFKRCGGAPD